MRTALRLGVLTLILTSVLAAVASPARAEPGLLLVAHGSGRPEWNQPVLDFGAQVAEAARKGGRFKAVRTAMLEAAQPDVPTAVAELESAGCDRIIAVPLFIAPSGHTHFDVPAVLGVYASPKTAAVLAEEGVEAARPSVPITLTQTLSQSDVLKHYALDQVRKLSRSPDQEAIVLLAHGDPEHELLVDRLMRQVATHCCGASGIRYADWAYVGVGQGYLDGGVAAVRRALDHRSRVLVVGLYVGLTASRMHQRRVAAIGQREPRGDPFDGRDVVLSDEAIISHPSLLPCVLDAAYRALAPPPHAESTTASTTAPPATRN